MVVNMQEMLELFGPEPERGAAKECLYTYTVLDWPVEDLPSRISAELWQAHIGGEIEDDTGTRQIDDQIAIRFVGTPRYHIYAIAALMAEIRHETEGSPPASCLQCGASLSNHPRGRTRRFCDNKGKCKQAYHRAHQRQVQRAETLVEHLDLLADWQAQHITGQLRALLEDILIRQGEEAARAATDAIVAYARQHTQEQPERKTSRRRRQPQSSAPPERLKRNSST